MAETMTPARTPGPWWHGAPEPRTGRIMVISRPRACGVAIAWTEADAALIAEAPALLEELRGLVKSVERAAAAGIDLTGYVGTGRALAVIAKAEGVHRG